MKSILIAEGDERVAELFAYLFAREGWSVTMYRDGQRAAAELGGSASYEAVLVSNRLRDMGGVELVKRIRVLDHRKDVPIVMVTRHPRSRRRGRRPGRRRGRRLVQARRRDHSRGHDEQVRRVCPASARVDQGPHILGGRVDLELASWITRCRPHW
jgi:CheY-like chemotaxis protein